MFARWFPLLDQAMDALVDRYKTAKSIRHDVPRFKSHDARMLFLAKQGTKGFFFKELAEEIRRDGHAKLRSTRAIVEYAWFLFSLADWKNLIAVVRQTAPDRPLPSHLADFYFLAAYRSNRERIVKGTDPAGFEALVLEAIRFIETVWPAERQRIDLFHAILRSSLGHWQEAREKIARSSVGLELIPPLAAARSVLPAPPARDSSSWSLEIIPAKRGRATLVSVDRNYYATFSRAFRTIHAATNPDRGVHFHCVGFDPREFDDPALDDMVGFTIDRTDISGLQPRDRQGYYACARLLHAVVYLDIYDNILISDIDGSVDRSVSDACAELPMADVIITSRILQPGRRLFNMPWSVIPAGANVVRNSTGGIVFARYLRDYLAWALAGARKGERPLWFADQCALFYAYVDLKQEVTFRNFDRHFYSQGMDWSPFSSTETKVRHIEEAAARAHGATVPSQKGLPRQ